VSSKPGNHETDEIAPSVSAGLESGDLSEAIAKISREMRASSPEEWARIASQANRDLDKLNGQFGSLDLVGVDGDNHLVIERQDRVRLRLDERAVIAGAEPASDAGRIVTNQDGSSILFTKQPDGQERPSLIVHADGSATTYEYDIFGDVSKVVETGVHGEKVSEYENGDGGKWVKVSGPAHLPAEIIGSLTVDERGAHVFRDLHYGTTTTRTADGTMRITSASGETIFEAGAKSGQFLISAQEAKPDALPEPQKDSQPAPPPPDESWLSSMRSKFDGWVANLPDANESQRSIIKTALWTDPNTALTLLKANPGLLDPRPGQKDSPTLAVQRTTVKTNIYANPDYAVTQLRSFPQLLD